MTFNASDKKEIVFAMKLMMEADNVQHPTEKLMFDCIYKSLNISDEEGLVIMKHFKECQKDLATSLIKHLSIVSSWPLEKKKDLISILTVMATIDKNIDKTENQLLTRYRITCGIDYTDYSLVEAMQDAKKYIIK